MEPKKETSNAARTMNMVLRVEKLRDELALVYKKKFVQLDDEEDRGKSRSDERITLFENYVEDLNEQVQMLIALLADAENKNLEFTMLLKSIKRERHKESQERKLQEEYDRDLKEKAEALHDIEMLKKSDTSVKNDDGQKYAHDPESVKKAPVTTEVKDIASDTSAEVAHINKQQSDCSITQSKTKTVLDMLIEKEQNKLHNIKDQLFADDTPMVKDLRFQILETEKKLDALGDELAKTFTNITSIETVITVAEERTVKERLQEKLRNEQKKTEHLKHEMSALIHDSHVMKGMVSKIRQPPNDKRTAYSHSQDYKIHGYGDSRPSQTITMDDDFTKKNSIDAFMREAYSHGRPASEFETEVELNGTRREHIAEVRNSTVEPSNARFESRFRKTGVPFGQQSETDIKKGNISHAILEGIEQKENGNQQAPGEPGLRTLEYESYTKQEGRMSPINRSVSVPPLVSKEIIILHGGILGNTEQHELPLGHQNGLLESAKRHGLHFDPYSGLLANAERHGLHFEEIHQQAEQIAKGRTAERTTIIPTLGGTDTAYQSIESRDNQFETKTKTNHQSKPPSSPSRAQPVARQIQFENPSTRSERQSRELSPIMSNRQLKSPVPMTNIQSESQPPVEFGSPMRDTMVFDQQIENAEVRFDTELTRQTQNKIPSAIGNISRKATPVFGSSRNSEDMTNMDEAKEVDRKNNDVKDKIRSFIESQSAQKHKQIKALLEKFGTSLTEFDFLQSKHERESVSTGETSKEGQVNKKDLLKIKLEAKANEIEFLKEEIETAEKERTRMKKINSELEKARSFEDEKKVASLIDEFVRTKAMQVEYLESMVTEVASEVSFLQSELEKTSGEPENMSYKQFNARLRVKLEEEVKRLRLLSSDLTAAAYEAATLKSKFPEQKASANQEKDETFINDTKLSSRAGMQTSFVQGTRARPKSPSKGLPL